MHSDFHFAVGAFGIGPAVGYRLQYARQFIAEEYADDCGGRFVGAETVVVARACHAYAQQILMFVHGGNHRRHDEQELRVVGGTLARLEEVVPEVGRQRPVVVFAAAVDSREGFFVEQAGHAVTGGDLFHDLHRHLVLVGGDIDCGVDGGYFMLRGGHFVVLGFSQHAEFPQFLVEVAHEGGDAGLDCAEIVVLEFLSLGGLGSEKRPAREDEVAAFEESARVDEEIFLLGSDGGQHLFRFSAEESEQTDCLFADGFHGAEKRSLFVEGVPVVTAERRGDAQRRVLDEGVGSGIPRGVAARFECGAQTAAGEGAGVGLAFDEFLAVELHDHAAVAVGSDEGVVLLGGQTRHGLEPVSKVSDALFHRPVLHGAGYDIGDFEGEGTVLFATLFELVVGAFGQALAHYGVVENHTAENFGHYHRGLLSACAV